MEINRLVVIITLVMTTAVFFSAIKDSRQRSSLPDFSAYEDVKQKKAAFFAFMLPLVSAQNAEIQVQRQRLEELKHLSEEEYSRSHRRFLEGLAEYYRLDVERVTPIEVQQLLKRVDEVPASLALAQAAMESAWGTSRFATEANNLFGQWCYVEGCGLVPLQRSAGSKHEVAKFDSAADAVASYLRNINTHYAYQDLRDRRAELRQTDSPVSGHLLAEDLINYSELRDAYVKEIQAVIRINKLAQYDVIQDAAQ